MSSSVSLNVSFFCGYGKHNARRKKPCAEEVRRGCTVPSLLSWSSTKASDGTVEFPTTGPVDGCSILLETQFVGTHLHVDNTWVLFVGASLPLRELPEIDQSLTSNRLLRL